MKQAENTWRMLDKPSLESLVFLAFYLPREKQNEAVELIYDRKARHVNLKPVIRARNRLSALGYIKVSSSQKDLRRKVIASQPEPFLQCAQERLRLRDERHQLSEDEVHVLRLILDSNWFRKAFFSNIDLEKTIGRNADGRFVLENAMSYMADKLESTSAITIGSAPLFPRKLPSMADVRNQKSFDQFIERWYTSKFDGDEQLERMIQTLIQFAENFLGKKSSSFLEKTLLGKHVALCIPFELADKMCRVGRIPLTILLAFVRASAFVQHDARA